MAKMAVFYPGGPNFDPFFTFFCKITPKYAPKHQFLVQKSTKMAKKEQQIGPWKDVY